MKKLFFTFVLFFSISIVCQSQVTYGVKLGLNSSSMVFTPSEGKYATASKMSLSGGVFGVYKVNEIFSIQPELLYSFVGAKTPGIKNQVKYNLSYVSLPILANYVSEPFSFFAGPQISYLVSAKGKVKAVNDQSYKADLKENFKNIDLAMLLGVSYDTEYGIGGYVRLQLGLMNIATNKQFENQFPGTGPDVKTVVNAVQIGLHYKFLKNKAKK